MVVEGEGTAQVGHALLAAEAGLGMGFAGAVEGVEDWQLGVLGDDAAEFFGLIEVAVLEASAMEWHGDERPVVSESVVESWVIEGGAGEVAEIAGEVDFALVFEAMDEVEGAVVTGERGAGQGEGECEVVAIWAVEGVVDLAGKHFTAGLAEWFC